ncbi:hypothetical protein LCGC14_1287090 [marine sediment metagenome]|uniref:UDP-N-acetylglucosamine 2-epimerase domain-containing protein n=1 Tax=marine sediment metagenome TaxID=412755 RepID=A0A0F9KV99_9ZZZZ
MKVLAITGTRPQIIKMGLLIKKLRIKGHNVYHVDTGQHYDKELYDDIYSSLKFEKPNKPVSFRLAISEKGVIELSANLDLNERNTLIDLIVKQNEHFQSN